MKRQHSVLPLILTLSLGACGGGDSATVVDDPVVEIEVPTDVSAVAAADPGSALPSDWHRSGAFMQIYVRGYKDSNGDGIGDLQGITQSLPYLKDLGIKGIWLMPINQSQDHDHGYAVSEYRQLESQYGTDADLKELLDQAHANGIGVIMDYVINHSAATNPLFVASKKPNSIYRNWYIWSASAPSGWSIYYSNPWHNGGTGYYFGGFWSQMPDFNLRNPSVIAYHHDNLRYWLNRGLDGFRFDAVGNLVENGPTQWESQPENYPIMVAVRNLLNGYSQRYMVCEAPANPSGFNSACGSAFAFGHNYNIVNAAKGNTSAIQSVADYFKSASASMATMLANHDSFAGARIYDQVGGNIAMYKLAAATYLTMPGIPFIYYGEEIGMAGGQGLSGDWALRTPMSWSGNTGNAGFTSGTPFRALSSNVQTFNVQAQQPDANSLHAFYKTLLGLRNSHPALSVGSYEFSSVQGSSLSYQRRSGSDRVLVVLNYGATAATVNVANLPASAALTPLYPSSGGSANADGSGNAALTLGARSIAIYQF